LRKIPMSEALDERRDFERVKDALSVTYRLLSLSEIEVPEEQLGGTTRDVNARGILLNGTIPSLDLVVPLLTQKVLISLEIAVPKPEAIVKALAAVRWIEAIDEKSNMCSMGLSFNDISPEARRKLFEHLVWVKSESSPE